MHPNESDLRLYQFIWNAAGIKCQGHADSFTHHLSTAKEACSAAEDLPSLFGCRLNKYHFGRTCAMTLREASFKLNLQGLYRASESSSTTISCEDCDTHVLKDPAEATSARKSLCLWGKKSWGSGFWGLKQATLLSYLWYSKPTNLPFWDGLHHLFMVAFGSVLLLYPH